MKLKRFLKEISYQFQNEQLLSEALTHPSLSKNKLQNYQRLEFLGDAILSAIIAEILIKKYPSENEGQLSKRQAYLVSGEVLWQIALKLNIGEILKISSGEEIIGGRQNKRNLENCLEALIGAIYLDSGLEACQKFINKFWPEFLEKNIIPPKDPVSQLQEIVQGKSKKLPEYKIEKTSGNEHQPVFTATLKIDGKEYKAEGFSKKEAQKNVAIIALEEWN